MDDKKLYSRYLIPTFIHIILVTLIAAILGISGLKLGYNSFLGIVLIILAGISSALWGVIYQSKYNDKNFGKIIKDFFDVRQSLKNYVMIFLFLVIDFGSVIICWGFKAESIWVPIVLFLKAIVFGGIEEIGWRYTFQPVIEKKMSYVFATFMTFLCWGIWHFLFFYIDGSIAIINISLFLLGLLTNSFVLSALFAYSNSLWICVMTHALINALSQISTDENSIASIVLKVICITIAIILYYVSKKKSEKE